MDDQTLVIILGAAAAVLLIALALLLFSRRQRVALSEEAAPTEKRSFTPHAAPAATLAEPLPPPAALDAAGDPLTTIKGLGPKAAAQLGALGIARFDQLAALDAAGVAALDAQMGPFKGRFARDRWVEQAALLAAGDHAGFEARFGRIGAAPN